MTKEHADYFLKFTPSYVKRMGDGEMVRAAMFAEDFHLGGQPKDCIWLLMCGSAEKRNKDGSLENFRLSYQEICPSLDAAIAKVEVSRKILFDEQKITIENFSDASWNGTETDNDNVYCFLVKMGDDVRGYDFVIVCKFAGTEEERKRLLGVIAEKHREALKESGKTDAEIDGEVG